MSTIRLGSVTLDCADPDALSRFWSALLGGEVIVTSEEYSVVRLEHLHLTTMRVEGYTAPTWPTGQVPKQIHLDLGVADLDGAAQRALSLGATRAVEQPDPRTFLVFLDPAGHPFCLTTQIPEEWLDR